MSNKYRNCCICRLTTSYKDKNGYEQWRLHNTKWYCKKCYYRVIVNPVRNKINAPRRIVFQDTRILLSNNPRKGVCEKCGIKLGDEYINAKGKIKILKKTDMHHMEYHDDDPLKDAIEICPSCHFKETWRLRRLEVTYNQ